MRRTWWATPRIIVKWWQHQNLLYIVEVFIINKFILTFSFAWLGLWTLTFYEKLLNCVLFLFLQNWLIWWAKGAMICSFVLNYRQFGKWAFACHWHFNYRNILLAGTFLRTHETWFLQESLLFARWVIVRLGFLQHGLVLFVDASFWRRTITLLT